MKKPPAIDAAAPPAQPGRVSVVIPCYAQEAYLGEAIQSVLGQTYPEVEVIVVDDGSPGNVAEVTKAYPGVRLLQQPNGGVARARNLGMAHCSGAFLVFLDADDRLLPEALEAEVRYLAEHPAAVFVSGQVRLIDREGRFLERPWQPSVSKDHLRMLLQTNYIWTPGAVMYRRTVFEKEPGFDPGAGGSADYELNIRLARKHPVGAIDTPVLEYRTHGANMSANAGYMLESGLRVRRAQYPFIRHDPALVRAWKQGIRAVQHDAGERLLEQIINKFDGRLARKGLINDLWCLLKFYPLGWPKRLVKWVIRSNRVPH